MLKRLWTDVRGSASAEWAFIAAILVLGAITGLAITKQLAPTDEEPPPVRSR
jgi:hypothetical protein